MYAYSTAFVSSNDFAQRIWSASTCNSESASSLALLLCMSASRLPMHLVMCIAVFLYLLKLPLRGMRYVMHAQLNVTATDN